MYLLHSRIELLNQLMPQKKTFKGQVIQIQVIQLEMAYQLLLPALII